VVAALFAGTSSASAQDNIDEKSDGNTAQKDDQSADAGAQTEKLPAPKTVAQSEPSQAGPSPTTPAPAPMTEDQIKKMIDEQIKASRKGVQLDFGGYARAGVGLTIRGGKQVCFNLPGADTHWRLGNECDYVIEPQFTGHLVQGNDGSSWGVVVMPGLYRTWEDQNPSQTDKTWFNDVPAIFRQIYFYGENIPQLANGRVWGGRRYYDRLHLDINDQFLEIHDSDGAGIEDMHVGPGKFSVAFLMNPNSEADAVMGVPTANNAPFKLNLRYTDIPTMPDANIQIWGGWQGDSTSKDQRAMNPVTITKADSLFRLGIYHTINKAILGGQNILGVKGEIGANHQLARAVVSQQVPFNGGHSQVDVIGEVRTQRDRPNDSMPFATNNWGSLGARVDHQLAGPFRFLLEAGWDGVFPAAGDSRHLFKGTACLAINAGDNNGARPTVRIFYTQGFWNDGAKAAFASGAGGQRIAQVYGDQNTGGSAGIQAEAWW